MGMLLAFTPFILFSVIERLAGVKAGLVSAAVGAAALLAFNLLDRRKSAKALEVGTAVLFGALAVHACLSAAPWPVAGVGLCVDAGLLGVVLVSAAIRRPFTLQYAREQVAPEFWDKPGFVRAQLRHHGGLGFGIRADGLVGPAFVLRAQDTVRCRCHCDGRSDGWRSPLHVLVPDMVRKSGPPLTRHTRSRPTIICRAAFLGAIPVLQWKQNSHVRAPGGAAMRTSAIAIFLLLSLFGPAPSRAADAGEAASRLTYVLEPVVSGGALRLGVGLSFQGDDTGKTRLHLPSRFAGQGRLYENVQELAAVSPGAAVTDTAEPDVKQVTFPPGQTVSLHYWQAGNEAGRASRPGGYFRPALQPGWFALIGKTFWVYPAQYASHAHGHAEVEDAGRVGIVRQLRHGGGGPGVHGHTGTVWGDGLRRRRLPGADGGRGWARGHGRAPGQVEVHRWGVGGHGRAGPAGRAGLLAGPRVPILSGSS